MPDTTVTERPRTVDEVTVANTRVGRFDYKWVALAVVLTGTIMTILDATIVNIAIPTLQHDLHAGSYTDIAWVVTGYLLAQGAVIPLSGWATDRWGTKKLYLITIVTFTVASMLCGVSQNLGELIFFRVVQGIGGGMLMPIGMTIILQAVGPQQMGRVMGIFGVPMLIAPAVGPVLLLGGDQTQKYRLDLGLRTFAHVLDTRPDAKLLVTGRLVFDAELLIDELGLQDRVELLGRYAQRDAPEIMRRAHLLLHTKVQDPCPSLVIEAMACGLPVVYPASGGTVELVGSDAGVGVAHPVGWERDEPPAPNELAAGVLRVLEDLPAYRAAARRRATDAFDVSPWLDRHEALFEELVARRQPR